jgi:hypothetical protein
MEFTFPYMYFAFLEMIFQPVYTEHVCTFFKVKFSEAV